MDAGDDAYRWAEGVTIRAALYPDTNALQERPFGSRQTQTLLMLYDGDEELKAGMGVSLDGGLPAYRIVSVERWAHTRALIRRIEAGRRGDA